LEAKGRLVTLEVLSVPFRNGDGVDGSGCFAKTGVVNEDFAVEALVALDAGCDNWVVPGVTTFSAAEASNATTPRSTDDATRSVNS
jgi:hypothetical protein